MNRTPEEYDQWILGSSQEAAEFEVAELIRISQNQKVIVDTNIPLDIADYHQVAVMLSPQAMSVEKIYAKSGFFTLVRTDTNKDTKDETLKILSTHFGLKESKRLP